MENKREDYADRHKEKEYMESMVKDLEVDIKSIPESIEQNEQQMKGIDSLLALFKDPIDDNKPSNEMVVLITEYLNEGSSFSDRNTTISQLKSSGNFRFIQNKIVADSIISYYEENEGHKVQADINMQNVQGILNLEVEIFNFNATKLSSLYDVSAKKDKLIELGNRTLFYKALLRAEVEWMEEIKKQAENLLILLKKEYNISDEEPKK